MKSVAAKVTVVSSVPATAMAARVGASLAAARVTVTVAAADESAPSEAVTVNVLAPFSFAAGS